MEVHEVRMSSRLSKHKTEMKHRTAMSKTSEPSKTDPFVQISWGELVDKITILEIKARALVSAKARANVKRELGHLRQALRNGGLVSPEVKTLKHQLKAVNKALWDIEDKIRIKESKRQFDDEFIELARSVYKTNDVRASLKKKMNTLIGSNFVEEKQYQRY